MEQLTLSQIESVWGAPIPDKFAEYGNQVKFKIGKYNLYANIDNPCKITINKDTELYNDNYGNPYYKFVGTVECLDDIIRLNKQIGIK